MRFSRIRSPSNCRTPVKETDTKEISIKGAQLTKEAITQELKDALESELREIGLDYLELELRPIGRRGATSHKIIFPSQDKKVNPSQVLSEGELCGVSIASFLAELEITSHECGIVLDDPVCSLDHQNREKIADRLVSEAMKRQVIVFTHDIAFLLALEESAYKNDVPFMCRTLIRAGDVVGICASERPWNSMSASERLRYIRGLFQDAASEHRKGNHEAYEENARKIYALMRETWERAVEDTLLNRTVERFRRGVETRRLEEVTVEEDDKRRIEQGMGKCSRWFRGHDQAAACDAPLPAPAELERDINELNDFISDITKRRERIRRKRAKV